MPGVKKPRPPRVAARPPVRPPVRPAVQDRPGRWQMLLRRQRRMLAPAAILLAVVLLAAAGLGAAHQLGTGDSLRARAASLTAGLGLRIGHVVIEGRQKTPEAMLTTALAATPGTPILNFSVAEARTRLEGIQWVESASVTRQLPDTIVVQITERSPFAVWQKGGEFKLIDRAGNIVSGSDVAAFSHELPMVVGPGADKAAAAWLDLLATFPAIQARVTASVRVGERRWNIRLSNGTDILLPEGAEAQALARLVELQGTHAVLDRPMQDLDLRLPDRFSFRPAGTPANAPANTPANTQVTAPHSTGPDTPTPPVPPPAPPTTRKPT